ncbi:MotB-like protein Atu3746 [hydrothermal vent metagenome]|uniref:MotB-like protein Atu3746 n=1 Tax=hydrothermal vent metagenome TaxID=652676 RepID=A0A3B0U726_9ZZZZ
MALTSRRRRSESGVSYWPGFVDILSSMLLVIIFLLSVFMLAQFFLSREVSGRDSALDQLRSRLAELTELLALEESSTKSLQASLSGLADGLSSADDEKDRLSALYDDLTLKNSDLEQRVMVLQDELETERRGKTAALAAFEQRQQTVIDLRSEQERQALLLSDLKKQTDEALSKAEADRIARQVALARAAASDSLIVDLRTEAEKRQSLLAALTADLEAEKTVSDKLEAELEGQKLLVVDLRGRADRTALSAKQIAENLATEKQALAALRERIKADALRRKEEEAQSGEAERRLVVLRDDLAKARAEREASQKDIDRQREELVVLRSKVDEAELKSQITAADLETQRQIVIDLRTRSGTASARAASLKTALETESAARRSALDQIELLNLQLNQLRRQLSVLEAALDASETRDTKQKTQIADLGRRLNVALAAKVQELSRYRSEFFGRLREILSQRSDIQIVGDRFVFQSEVLFGSASAKLNAQGLAEMHKLAAAIIQLEYEIPPEINWVLRVDGHTDQRPINTFQFKSNWELSSARAISVVQFLIGKGVNPAHLIAAGFGEYQPIDPRNTLEAFRKNRRIELKLTER